MQSEYVRRRKKKKCWSLHFVNYTSQIAREQRILFVCKDPCPVIIIPKNTSTVILIRECVRDDQVKWRLPIHSHFSIIIFTQEDQESNQSHGGRGSLQAVFTTETTRVRYRIAWIKDSTGDDDNDALLRLVVHAQKKRKVWQANQCKWLTSKSVTNPCRRRGFE